MTAVIGIYLLENPYASGNLHDRQNEAIGSKSYLQSADEGELLEEH